MLYVNKLSHRFGSVPVLNRIGFRVEPGELCGLFGPNGSGKTTLFKCCLGFIVPDEGEIRLKGRDIREMSCREMARQVAYVPQHHTPPFPFRVSEVVLMGRTPHMGRFCRPKKEDRVKADQAMVRVGIGDLADRPYDTLSGGQQQLVLIARAIAQETDLIFLDEPASALDFKNQVVLWKTLRRVADQGTAILACSHDPNHVAWFCDTTVVLGPSGLLARGEADRVISQELMDAIYRDTCHVRNFSDLKMIVPSGLTARHRTAAGPVS